MSDPSPRGPSWLPPLPIQVLLAMILGGILGATLGEDAANWLGWIGTVFIRLLRMVIVPLVVTSIVTGVASVGSGRTLGRLGLKTFIFYVSTSLAAILVGLALVNIIKPGAYADASTSVAAADLPELETPGSMLDVLLRMIPVNPVAAATNGDMLGLIFFSVLLGIAMTQVARRGDTRINSLFASGFDVMMVLTAGVIRLLPLGVLGLVTRTVAESDVTKYKQLGVYMLTVAGGLAIHLLVTLPLFLLLVGRINPITHFKNMSSVLLTAFSTSSSSATLPLTMQTVEKKVGVSNKVTSFVLPLGATINMDGTALYECVAVIFISQVMGFGLNFEAQVMVVATALLASVGAAGIPSAGLVMIFIVTEAVNLRGPQVELLVGMLLAIDRPLDMLRTMVNVFSDSCGAAIIARSEGETGVDSG